jgi:hypothetical protein
MDDVKYLCTGEGCPIKGDCAKYDVNNECSPTCEGLAYFIKCPWDNGWCAHYYPAKKRIKEKGDGQP